MSSARQTQLLCDIAMLAQLACESHKRRSHRIGVIIQKLAELEHTPVSKARASMLLKHIRASSDATDADVHLDSDHLIIEAPFNIDLQELSRRVLW